LFVVNYFIFIAITWCPKQTFLHFSLRKPLSQFEPSLAGIVIGGPPF